MQGRPKSIMTPGGVTGNVVSRATLEDPWVRFQIELEFVQCLGNPDYLTFLSQQGCFDKPEFVNYLAYLQYWKEPAYSKFVTYPYCIHMLELLQSPEFRREVARDHQARFIDDQILLHWQSYLRKRAEMINRHVDNLATTATATATE